DASVARVAQERLARGLRGGLPDLGRADGALHGGLDLALRVVEADFLQLGGVEHAERAQRRERRELVVELRGGLGARKVARRRRRRGGRRRLGLRILFLRIRLRFGFRVGGGVAPPRGPP